MKSNLKANIKKGLWLLLCLPVLLLTTACGTDVTGELNTKATCNTTGAYTTASTKAELTEAIGEQTSVNTAGYRLTMTTSMGEGRDMEINMIVKGEELALKATAPASMMGDATATGVIDYYMFFKDGKIYMEMPYQNQTYKIYMEMNFGDLFGVEASAGLTMSTPLDDMPFHDVQSMLEAINEAGDNVVVTKDGNNFKIVVSEGFNFDDDVTVTEATCYINFDSSNHLTAMQIDFEGNSDGSAMTGSATLSGYTGALNFPSFNDYKSMYEVMAEMMRS